MDLNDLTIEPVEGFHVFPRSRVTKDGTMYFLAQDCSSYHKYLGVRGDTAGFDPPDMIFNTDSYFTLNARNAAQLRQRLPWMRTQAGGLKLSFGFGDRLGLASPGHAMACWEAKFYPIFAQQSVRENDRTGRTPQQVVDEAMWGIFQTGWGKPWGADADHLKKISDLKVFVDAGYTFFTVDPGEYVGQNSEKATLDELKQRAAELPWHDLDSSPEKVYAAYLDKTYRLDGVTVEFDETTLLQAVVKYGGAIAHTIRMYKSLVALVGSTAFDFEVSVDETETPTQIPEHFYISHELRRMGVHWNSLAPRFPGRFEKGVDFIGDLQELDRELAQHAAIMRHFGNYKLSLHSGSDKFSVYELLAKHAGELVHVKTAGTSYLEALRVTAQVDPVFFSEILDFSRQRYPTDRATYHVSGELKRVPAASQVAKAQLPDLLDDFHARQVLHVTFGSVLDQFGARLKDFLLRYESNYTAGLQKHFKRHLDPFLNGSLTKSIN